MLREGRSPRTSPYPFRAHEEGLKLLKTARQETGLPIVTEIMDLSHLEFFVEDVIQVAPEICRIYAWLATPKPILLKRGLANTIENSDERQHIMSGGNVQVILCEWGYAP